MMPPKLITKAELDKMPRTPGTCAYCQRDTMVYALIEFTCRKCVLDDIDAHEAATGLDADPEVARIRRNMDLFAGPEEDL